MASIKKRPDGKWRARYRDQAGKEHARHFVRKVDAQRWLDEETASLVTGRYVDPKARKTTVDEWCDRWLEGYGSRRESTVRQAKVHLAQIRKEFGPLPLGGVRPSMVKTWCARLLAEGSAQSYVFALHSRLSQVMTDAVIDGLVAANPCSRRTSPGAGKPRPYLATEAQVWELYDRAEEKYRAAILLGAFAGLRLGEACGLRIEDVHFLRREIAPAVQYPAEPLKTDMSRETIPIADALVTVLAQQVGGREEGTVLVDDDGGALGPWKVERHMRRIRRGVDGLPDGFRFHDLRHFYASLLIASGADVKVVQHRLRHASAKTTLDTYGHLWPDSDESTRTAVERVMNRKINNAADSVRTTGEAAS
ncbi:site-specific integrase [Sphaerisporangium rhizosphaerae]|uniref:Tyrosine recombinase XerC n=1 Tax=Sphaerisporangium rhizosphaerae TaxID=2269375 RepID=A0ABW2NZM8_9ACTN